MSTQKTNTAKRSWPKGFTLGELIVVVTILAILATIGFLALSGYSQDAKSSAAKTNVRSVYSAIVSESAVTGNSARYYVVHDPVYALSGGVVAIDGNPKTLTGGDWNQPGTNYSAGNPDFVKLKMNPEKFRVSDFIDRLFLKAYSANVTLPIVGAAELTETQNGKTRPRSYVQVVGITPDKIAYVTGNYPVGASGSVSGLIKDVSNPSLTGALSDGGTAGSTIACPTGSGLNGSVCVPSLPGSCGTSNNQSFSAAPSTNLCTSTGGVSAVTGAGPWNWSCLGQYGGGDAACAATKFAYKCLCNNDVNNTIWYVSSNLTGGGCSAYSTCGNCGNGGGVFWTCYAQ